MQNNFERATRAIRDCSQSFGSASTTERAESERVKSRGVTAGDLNKDDLLVCASTVLAFSLGDKTWGETAVILISQSELTDRHRRVCRG